MEGEKRALVEGNAIGWEHMVRRCRPPGGARMRLPSRLLGMLRVVVMDEEDMVTWQGNPRLEKVMRSHIGVRAMNELAELPSATWR